MSLCLSLACTVTGHSLACAWAVAELGTGLATVPAEVALVPVTPLQHDAAAGERCTHLAGSALHLQLDV